MPLLDVAGLRGKRHREVGKQLVVGKQQLGEVLRQQRREQAAALLEESKQVGRMWWACCGNSACAYLFGLLLSE
jgi:hypothetical protein